MLVGIVFGIVIQVWEKYHPNERHGSPSGAGSVDGDGQYDPSVLGFSSTAFFFLFLPPIIFNSGYHLKRRLFYANFFAIFMLAVVGTLLSTAVIAAGLYFFVNSALATASSNFSLVECIAFGSLISSTDPVSTLVTFSSMKVDPTLYYLTFGESMLNDAIALTIFNVSFRFVDKAMTPLALLTMSMHVCGCFLGSTAIGYGSGILGALALRAIDPRSHGVLVVAIVVCTAYIPFFVSEVLELSGIVTILFCGIAARRYVNKNISSASKRHASFVFQLIAYLAETSCFALLGLSMASQSFDTALSGFIVWTVLLCWFARAVQVYPLLTIVSSLDLTVNIFFIFPIVFMLRLLLLFVHSRYVRSKPHKLKLLT